jgi:hypothetical protein
MARRGRKQRLWRQAEEASQKFEEKFYKQFFQQNFVQRECSLCHSAHPCDIFGGQGWGFSAEADAKGVSAGFGSRFDLLDLVWTNGQQADGMICDECIAMLLKDGSLKVVGQELSQGEVDGLCESASLK